MGTDKVVVVKDVYKSYGDVQALDGISLSATEGEIFGILGPNGAGKTTLLEIIEGLRRSDRGTVYIKGIDVSAQTKKAQSLIGVQLQESQLFERMTVYEILDFFAAITGRRRQPEHLLSDFALEGKRNAQIKTLSGGQQQRLHLALAVVNSPEVVFLDEPTTGLDPQARFNLWEIIKNLKTQGETVILTTHYMEEAETLCDRIAILDYGQVIALDHAPGLIERYASSEPTMELVLSNSMELDEVLESDARIQNRSNGNHYVLRISNMQATLAKLMKACEEQGVQIVSLNLQQPSLEDVFLNLTGRKLRE